VAVERKFQKLFEPFRLGQMELRNRLVMPPIATCVASEDGYVTGQTLDYYEERARGGVGLIIVGEAIVDLPRGLEGPRRIGIDDKHLPGLTSLAEVIKKHGARAAIQLNHGGGFAVSSTTGLQPVAPSSVIYKPGRELPRELTIGEIHDLVLRFADAAQRAKRAGFEGVEIHASGSYLIKQFLTPGKNKRTDAYGGGLANRARFLLEILAAVRERVGPEYPLWVRIIGKEYGTRDGITLEDATALSKMLEEAGCCAINVNYTGSRFPFHRMAEPTGSFLHLAEAVKRVVSIPVIAVGRISPEVGERAVSEGKADLVAIARGLLADPELPNKAASGRLDDIVPCITCLVCGTLSRIGEAGCTVNPALGKEREFKLAPAEQSRRVLVVGGGPAGMGAAIMAARRGHHVTLYEKKKSLGGQLRLATKVPYRGRIADLISYLSLQVVKHGIDVKLGREVTPTLIDSLKPDVVILATGSKISLLRRIAEIGASILAGGQYNAMEEEGLMLKDTGARRQPFGAHTILLGASQPDQSLLKELQGRVPQIYLAGDCITPYGMMEAMASGVRVGLAV
jgi:2,4-dienoyl-CoA reductase-like NADH-dependent reductase (Old Yellow Enzyme family)